MAARSLGNASKYWHRFRPIPINRYPIFSVSIYMLTRFFGAERNGIGKTHRVNFWHRGTQQYRSNCRGHNRTEQTARGNGSRTAVKVLMARGEWLKKIFERLAVNGTAGCSRLTGCGKVSTIRNTKEFSFYIRRSNAKIHVSKSANYSDFDISWRMFRFTIVWDTLTCFDVSHN